MGSELSTNMAAKRSLSNKRRRHAARRVRSPHSSKKHPLKGMLPRSIKQGALPPNQDNRKYPDEEYGDTEIPLRNP